MKSLIVFPLLLLAVILQSSIISQVQLISGTADLILLMLGAWALQERVNSAWQWAALASLLASFISRMPWFVIVSTYFGVVFLAQALQRRVWQAPLLAMFSVTFAGTLFSHALSFAVLRILGVPLVWEDVAGLVTLPSLLLNMLFSIPIYAFMRDLARWMYAAEELV